MALAVGVPTDKVRRQLGTIPYISGGGTSNPLLLGQVDYLAELEFVFNGTMTCVGTGANSLFARGPFNLIRAILLNVNGRTFPVSADAFGLYLLRSLDNPPGGGRSPILAPVASSASPGTANTWKFSFRVPLAVSLLRNDLRGIIWAGNLSTQISVQVVWNPESAAVNLGSGNTATMSGSLAVNSVSLVAPPPAPAQGKGAPQGLYGPASYLHTFTQKTFPITQTGDNIIPLDKGNRIMRLILAVKNNGDYNTDILSQIRWDIQGLVNPQTYEADWLREQLVDMYAFPYDATSGLPYIPTGQGAPECTGVYVLDLFQTFTDRDMLDATGLTQLNIIPTVKTGTTLSGCQIDLYQEQLVTLAGPITV
jgi:hypothetical protein